MTAEQRAEKILSIAREHSNYSPMSGSGVGEAARAAILAEVRAAIMVERAACAAAVCLGCASALPILTAKDPSLPLFHLSEETDLFQQCAADPILRRGKG